ncbi:hypothetical protein CDL12_25472 [Handroanthus impetiginosus]|uniref:Uncharacterized protein n=1 Tax=Handroanthus impetiginosus TaxID=429701 RepID=A0A2G9G9Q1_9LAMI|nr:hypothetical protein CDL12_25472 [Handroanthus impetiginosus]
MANERTLRELAVPNLIQQLLCIEYPKLDVPFELKFALIHFCPQHGISEQLLIQYFYEGLMPIERMMIDATSRGAIANKTLREARSLISIMAANPQQFGRQERAFKKQGKAFKTWKKQVSLLATSLSRLESQGKLPSHTVINPMQKNSPITLRNGKEFKEPTRAAKKRRNQSQKLNNEAPNPIIIHPLFPKRFAKSKKKEEENDILETFRNVEVNFSFLDAIRQILCYAKFLKKLCNEKISVKDNIYVVL